MPVRADLDLAERVRALWAGSLSAAQIASLLGLSRSAILGVVHRGRARDGEKVWPSRGKGWASRTGRTAQGQKRANAAQVRRLPPQKPRKAIPLPPGGKPILWLARRSNQCAYIADDPSLVPIDELRCCGAPVDDHAPWCAWHRDVVLSGRLALADDAMEAA